MHMNRLANLSSREKEIIRLVFHGNTSKHIAEKLHISPLTVSTHRKNIKAKLEIKNFNELFKFAEEFDLL